MTDDRRATNLSHFVFHFLVGLIFTSLVYTADTINSFFVFCWQLPFVWPENILPENRFKLTVCLAGWAGKMTCCLIVWLAVSSPPSAIACYNFMFDANRRLFCWSPFKTLFFNVFMAQIQVRHYRVSCKHHP